MNIEIGNIANIVQGHVLDCNKKHLEEALRRYDDLLYLKWNPKKIKWELRRKPSSKIGQYMGKFLGMQMFILEYKENEFEHHVKDFDYLNYKILDWVRANDVWELHKTGDKFAKFMDYEGDRITHKKKVSELNEMKYAIKQEKKALREIKEKITTNADYFREFIRGFGGPS